MDEDPFSGWGLKPITFADQARITDCFSTLAAPLSDYTFSQLITWGNSLRILWKEIRGHVCVFANGTGDLTLLMPPIGDGDAHGALLEAFEVMDDYNRAHRAVGRSRVEYVSDELLARLDRPKLAVTPMGADYVYDVRRMIDLAGGDLASKRQLRNRFLRNYEHRVEVYDRAKHAAGCRQLLKLWNKQQDGNDDDASTCSAIKRQKETLACELALEYAADLDLKGLVVYVKGEADWSIRGFTFGEPLGADQSSILIEKTDLGVRGLAQFIFSEFCHRFWSHRPLVNAGDDWGLESLAWTKMSYRPVTMLQKYEIRLPAPVIAHVPLPQPNPAPMLPVPRCDERETDRHRRVIVDQPEPQPTPDGVLAAALVRKARKQDLAAAALLEQSCFSSHQISKRQLSYLHRSPNAVFLVAEIHGSVIGEGIALIRRHKRGQSGRIYSLAVGGEHRRERIGQRLLEAMLTDLAFRGVARIYLEVEQSNASAVRLYERAGFRIVERLPGYYGNGRAGVRMACQLTVPMRALPAAVP